jgi:hypothetical protein
MRHKAGKYTAKRRQRQLRGSHKERRGFEQKAAKVTKGFRRRLGPHCSVNTLLEGCAWDFTGSHLTQGEKRIEQKAAKVTKGFRRGIPGHIIFR